MPTTLEQPAPTFSDVWRMFQETDRKFQETERLMKERSLETDKAIKKVSDNIDKLGNRLGEFVEAMVKPGLVRLFQARGLKVHRTMQNLTCRDDGGQRLAEVDLLVVDTDTAIVVECKSFLGVDDINEHLERMAKFKTYWPEYAAYKLLGAVAAMVLPDSVGRYAWRKGLFVLAQNGEIVEIRNDDRFEPKVW